ncbi:MULTISPECIES: hypothetical protein [unclassified Chelatococcus]|uniref:hypothetical protein n=1 Tax=unclassified Chelatococcus TaxID=2638111 RepID=UPI00058B84D4|nr:MULTISPECIES: hypothetical protein [unclassified Chelatococcus]ALA16272.1 hypothetical protein AL346_01190 [Chelatococcus sp. CO-6]
MPTTSSSTSSSEAGDAAPWRRFAATFVGAAVLTVGIVLGAVVVLDPYDTGRGPVDWGVGVSPQGPRTANASRGRDPSFNAAVIGNSHVQLLSPERLSAGTGLSFVSLIVPGTGAREQVAMLDWFVRHHEGTARAVVLGIDEFWCEGDPALPLRHPFPFWLYDADVLSHLKGLLRFDVVERLGERVAFLAGYGERARPDGYWDYAPEYLGMGYDGPDKVKDLSVPRPTMQADPTGRFPAAVLLRKVLAGLPPDLVVVLISPPVFIAGLPAAGSEEAANEGRCMAAFAALAAGRPRTAWLDWRSDRPENRDPANFFDKTHYRASLAHEVERAVAQEVSKMTAAE